MSQSTPQPQLSLAVQWRLLQGGLLVGDILMLELAFLLAYQLRFDLELALAPWVAPTPLFYARLVAALIPLWISLFYFLQLYNRDHLLGGTDEYARVFHGCTIGMMVVVVISFAVPTFMVARGWLVASWLLSIFLVTGTRFWIRRIAYYLRYRGYLIYPAVIVGTNQEAQMLARQLQLSQYSGLHIVGLVDGLKGGSYSGPLPLLGTLAEIDEIVLAHGINEVVVASSALGREELLEVFERLSGLPDVDLHLSSGLLEVIATGVHVKQAGHVPLMTLNKLRLDPLEVAAKTLLDYILAFLAVLCLLPLYLVIALLIKWSSPGPILYRRQVLGLRGRSFHAYKFRTMFENGDEILARYPHLQAKLAANHKLRDDPRITWVGRHLRKYSLDELPQLFNVLRGQMSLVGPRMIAPEEADKYGRLRMNLLTVKPGITGLWQVSGRSDISYEERVQLDTHYIRTYSIWQDLQILFVQTLPAVIRGRGAY